MTRYRPELGTLVLALALGACREAADEADPPAGDGLPEGAEAISLLGEPLYPAPASAEQAQDIKAARADYDTDPDDADAIIWLGRRIGYTGAFREAIAVFSEGIEKHRQDARMCRHRGHRWISDRRLVRISARNRLSSYRTARSALISVEPQSVSVELKRRGNRVKLRESLA